ncbi:threonine ammonia-lyase [Streptantibioticus ferralitis]|uniref:Pyridoxal-phosphate dependent enzyme n=1 Tax=Streptantibioticus ferralitis TaxID=236510 RepID=A0ABT5Z1F4_9ACTN|nr:pyridoxal-phosphate dependent enzyme [Streptantibioticus ferralitis]MDF2257662.1 pyridoxal-phosphate dependent enzyme [Streptantibioticus ferralitis]
MSITAHNVGNAIHTLEGVAVHTPVLHSPGLDRLLGRRVLVKAENLQRGGSFKFRGAYHYVSALGPQARSRGVVGASSGNHGQALALAAQLLRVPATVVVPQDAPRIKLEGIAAAGARIVRYQRGHDDRDAIVADHAQRRDLAIVPSANHPLVIAGAGTVAWELLREHPETSIVLVPLGGGGLAAGTALITKALHPKVKVIGVEPNLADDTARSLRAGRRVAIPAPRTIADGLTHTTPAPIPYEINARLLDDVITVPESAISDAMALLYHYFHQVAEPSGAVALAGLLAAPGRLPTGTAAVVLSGGNVDWSAYRTLLNCSLTRMENPRAALPGLRQRTAAGAPAT